MAGEQAAIEFRNDAPRNKDQNLRERSSGSPRAWSGKDHLYSKPDGRHRICVRVPLGDAAKSQQCRFGARHKKTKDVILGC
jgi:hypothetical protein